MRSAHVHRIDRGDLESVLKKIVARHFGPRTQLKTWRRRVSAYSSSCVITWIRLLLNRDCADIQVAFKDLTPGFHLPTARRVRPQFLYDPGREIATYKDILDQLTLGTPRYLEADVAPATPKYWLFVEWVNGPLLWQMGRMRHWQQAARWLARFHHEASRLPDLERRTRSIRPLSYDQQAYTNWITRAESVLSGTLLRRDRRSAQQFARLTQHYDRVINHLCRLPRTLVHGEFFPANIVMRWTGKTHRVCPIDWELTGWGPTVLDLAALSAGQWSTQDKLRIIAAYHETATTYSPSRGSLDELVRSVAYAQLHLCVRQLGWAARWRPQGQQARTWLTDALNLASQLGL
jgi:thiamine kinase-like enzyme